MNDDWNDDSSKGNVTFPTDGERSSSMCSDSRTVNDNTVKRGIACAYGIRLGKKSKEHIGLDKDAPHFMLCHLASTP